jgi:hypothetical protein
MEQGYIPYNVDGKHGALHSSVINGDNPCIPLIENIDESENQETKFAPLVYPSAQP